MLERGRVLSVDQKMAREYCMICIFVCSTHLRNEKTLLILTIIYVRIIIKVSDLLDPAYSPSLLKYNA